MKTRPAQIRTRPVAPSDRAAALAARGFSLIEIMIVLVIIVALAGLVGLTLFSRQDDAKLQLARTDHSNIEKAMGFFRLDFGRFPTDEEGVAVLWSKSSLDPDVEETMWKGYLNEPLPTDRWGNEWGYRQISENTTEDRFDLWSNGPDGEEGTEDDITSWEGWAGEDGMGGSDLLAPPSGSMGP